MGPFIASRRATRAGGGGVAVCNGEGLLIALADTEEGQLPFVWDAQKRRDVTSSLAACIVLAIKVTATSRLLKLFIKKSIVMFY